MTFSYKRTSEKLFFYVRVLGFAPPAPQLWGEKDRKSPKFGGFRGPELDLFRKEPPQQPLQRSLAD
ncbi:hypothetical protein H1P_3460001 [Hyella patelloides LEGE 07179]|uniref:Uncharacterized protein n=1 Tax=Hyella patelloides LEGE 07179 TaxID=945734 RepID=A0A563VVX0_9CYAN|nr:hypothetical protein H1P_3460001 [Hyella patelloides LEGE 07179]